MHASGGGPGNSEQCLDQRTSCVLSDFCPLMLKVLAPKQSETDSRFGRAVKAPCMYPPRPGGSGH